MQIIIIAAGAAVLLTIIIIIVVCVNRCAAKRHSKKTAASPNVETRKATTHVDLTEIDNSVKPPSDSTNIRSSDVTPFETVTLVPPQQAVQKQEGIAPETLQDDSADGQVLVGLKPALAMTQGDARQKN